MSISKNNADGVLYVGNVKWSSDYKHAVLFNSKNERDSFFKNNLKRINTNVIFLNPNNYIDIDERIEGCENLNYCYFTNDSEISNTGYCCFITNFEYRAPNTTRLYIALDVFQMYIYDTVFYSSIIARGHVANDSITRWTAPEPINFSANVQNELTAFSGISFEPVLVMDTVSEATQPGGGLQVYKYGGFFPERTSFENATGIFRYVFGELSASSLISYEELVTGLIKRWSLKETEQDTTTTHLNDIQNFSFIPKWVFLQASKKDLFDVEPVKLINSNAYATISDTVNISTEELASGYRPKNKKMFTSLARAILLYNKNGLSVPLAPELLANINQISLTLQQRPLGDTYKVTINGYKDLNKRYFNASYSFPISIGFNSNVGDAQATRLAQLDNQAAILKVGQVTQGVGAAFSVVGNVGMLAAGNPMGAVGLMNDALSVTNQIVQNKSNNYNQQVNYGNALSSIAQTVGSNGDRTNMSDNFCKLRIADCSPNFDECAIMDDFLTLYGYAIQEYDNPKNWLKTRKYWNFIQTDGINLQAKCPSNYEQILKQIFNSGVTIWHNYSYYGNYSLNNEII